MENIFDNEMTWLFISAAFVISVALFCHAYSSKYESETAKAALEKGYVQEQRSGGVLLWVKPPLAPEKKVPEHE